MRESLIKTITDGLSWLAYKLHGRAAARLFDLHIISEDFARDFMNCLRGLNLINLNDVTGSHPAVDLGDRAKRVSFQVTTDGSSSKIRETLSAFQSLGMTSDYDEISFIILGKKRLKYPSFDNFGIPFEAKTNIIDIQALIRETMHCDLRVLEQLAKIVEHELSRFSPQQRDEEHKAIRDFVVIEDAAIVERRQIVFRNEGKKTVRNVYLGSFLISEDGANHIVLYDEIKKSIKGEDEVVQGDILSGEGRIKFLKADIDYYGETLDDRVAKFTRQNRGDIRLVVALRSVGDLVENTLLSFFVSDYFRGIACAIWRDVDEDGNPIYTRALRISDEWYKKRCKS